MVLSVRHLLLRRSLSFTLRLLRLNLQKGKILCVTGPNGSGKSTLLSCLVGLLSPDSGQITVAGQPVDSDLKTMRLNIGYIPDDEEWFIKELSAKEYFELLTTVYRHAGVTRDTALRARQLARALHFTAFDQKLEQLSHGNKKKVQLVAGLMHYPKLIVADELRNGLDPLAIIAAERLLRAEAKRGAAIVAATHDLWWAERIADNVLLLIDGSVAVHGRKKALIKKHSSLEHLFMQMVESGR